MWCWAVFVDHEVTRPRGAGRRRRGSASSRWSRRCGGSPGCGPRASTASPVTRYTETYKTVAEVSSAARGAARARATGSSTATTSSARGRRRARPTRTNLAAGLLSYARARAGHRGRRAGALALPGPLPRHRRGGRLHRRRVPPVGQPVAARRAVQGVHPHRRRPGPAQHAPRRPAGGRSAWPCSSGARRVRASGAASRVVDRRHRPGRRSCCSPTCRRCGPARWWPTNLERPEDIPSLLDAGGRRTSRARATRHPGARGARFGLRQLPLGQHGRSRHARPDGPAVRGPRAVPVRLGAVGAICSTPSTPASRRAT